LFLLYDTRSGQGHCDFILQRCRGLDETEVIDDQGGLAKTVSVENSFRRGTMRTMRSVRDALDQLLERLPRLLRDRKSWSTHPDRAFPTTIRITARVVDERLRSTKRRPYVTKSAQKTLDGQSVLQMKDLGKQSEMLRHAVTPLVRQLLGSSDTKDLDVTRLNLATSNFQDIPSILKDCKTINVDSFGRRGTSFLNMSVNHNRFRASQMNETCSYWKSLNAAPVNTNVHTSNAFSQNDRIQASGSELDVDIKTRLPRTTISSEARGPQKRSSFGSGMLQNDIDPSVLAALPPDIAAEVLRAYPLQNKKHKIDHFFVRKAK
jgi:impB/mucB/samB family C-terminal domain/Ubiquitin binding region